MTISGLINNLNSFSRTPCYDNPMYCCDGQDQYNITDIAVSNGCCFIFYGNHTDYTESPRFLVAKLRRYSHQKDYLVQFVNYETNDVFTKVRFSPYYNLVIDLIS